MSCHKCKIKWLLARMCFTYSEAFQLVPVHSGLKNCQSVFRSDLVVVVTRQSGSGDSLSQEVITERNSDTFADQL